jgi:hypothetical protein
MQASSKQVGNTELSIGGVTRKHIDLFLIILSTLSASVLVMGNFLINRHITLPSIGLAVLGGCVILKMIIERKISSAFDIRMLICFWAIFGIFCFACYFKKKVLTFKSIILGYSLIAFFFTWKDKRQYYAVFMAFILTNTVFAIITLYNYYDLIYVHKAQGLDITWVNFIDMMYDKIIPSHLYHHLLSVFTVFSIYLCYNCLAKNLYLINKAEKYLQVFLLVFLAGFLHFLSARIGLLLFYIGLISWIFYSLGQRRSSIIYLITALFIVSALLLAFYFIIPTIKIKTALTFNEISFYMHSDYNEILNGPNYRLKTYLSAIEDIRQSPIHGIGSGQISEKIKNMSLPHNIYLFYSLFLGLPVAIALLIFTYTPLFFIKKRIGVSVLVIYFIHTIYGLTDMSLEIREYFYFFSFWLPFMISYEESSVDIKNAD